MADGHFSQHPSIYLYSVIIVLHKGVDTRDK